MACLKGFSKWSLLRCARHFEANSKDFLIGMAIKGNMKYATLDVVSSKHGLVKNENKHNLTKNKRKMLLLCSQKWKNIASHRTSS